MSVRRLGFGANVDGTRGLAKARFFRVTSAGTGGPLCRMHVTHPELSIDGWASLDAEARSEPERGAGVPVARASSSSVS